MTERRKTRESFFALIVFGAAAGFLLWKCRFGFANMDESFYLTIPRRFLAGDAPFTDEWNLSQGSSVLLLPFMMLYNATHSGTDGMMLFFRCLFTVVHSLAAVFLYFRLRRIDRLGAFIAAVGFQLFTPFGIMALSYNSMGLLSVTLGAAIYATAEKNMPVQYMICGILLSCAVLCCPFLIILYAVFTLAAAVYRRRSIHGVKIGASWCYVTLGVAVSALAFLVFVASKSSVPQILQSLVYVLDDPEHQARSFWVMCRTYVTSVFTCNGKWSFACVSMYIVLAAAALSDRRRRFAPAVFLAAGLITALYELSFIRYHAGINSIMFPMNMFALLCRLSSRNEQVKKLFSYMWVPGMLYSFCIHCASNQEFSVISSASTVAFVASVIMVVLVARDLCAGEDRRLVRLAVAGGTCLMLLLQLGSEAVLRYNTVFWESGMAELTEMISVGPEKGLLTTAERKQFYESYYASVTEMPAYRQAASVAFLSEKTWLYLFDNKECGAYSSWLSGGNAVAVQRLLAFYELNADKVPQLMLAENQYEQYCDLLCERLGYSKYKTEL